MYVIRHRAGTGRDAPMKRYTIGRHGSPWTPETARAEAKRLLGMVAARQDPAGAQGRGERSPDRRRTGGAVPCRACRGEAQGQHRRPNTGGCSTRSSCRRSASGRWRTSPAPTSRSCTMRTATTPYQANRVLAVLSKMFNLAERWGLRPDGSNPCRHVEKFAERKRERMLSPAELARLGDALAAYDGSPYAVAAVKLLVFTGARLGEVLGLKWEWIDFERGEARLPDSKTGAKTLHLPPPALAVLAELPRLEGNPHVIAGGKAGAALVNLEKPWRAIRKAAGLDDVRLHDLRHAFASVAASSGMGLPIIGKMLGHTQPATTARYAHLASDPVKAAAAAVAGKIAAAMAGGKMARPARRGRLRQRAVEFRLGGDRPASRQARTPHRASLPPLRAPTGAQCSLQSLPEAGTCAGSRIPPSPFARTPNRPEASGWPNRKPPRRNASKLSRGCLRWPVLHCLKAVTPTVWAPYRCSCASSSQ